jgi:transposase
MSESERRRLEVFSRVRLGELSVAKAGRMIGISERQARRLWRRYSKEGDAGLIHGLRGRPSNASDVGHRQKVLARYRQRYLEFGAAHAAEHLADEGLKVSRQTLWYWLDEEELVVQRRKSVPHRIRRERRACVGELVQMDGSTHDWLGTGVPCVLFVMVDDASGEMYCRFYESEDMWSAFDLFGRYVKKRGLPRALYVDKDSIYRVNDKQAQEAGKQRGRPPLTQFGRAMKQLGVETICANSPQAKGRVERMNGTLQDRLVKELALMRAKTIAAANKYLDEKFLRRFNARFKRPPADGVNLHQRLPRGVDLRDVLCAIEPRVAGRDWCVRFDNRVLQIDKKHESLALAGKAVEVLKSADGTLRLRYGGKFLRWRELESTAASRQASRPMLAPLDAGSAVANAPAAPLAALPLPTTGGGTNKPAQRINRSSGRSAKSWRPSATHPWNRPIVDTRVRRG